MSYRCIIQSVLAETGSYQMRQAHKKLDFLWPVFCWGMRGLGYSIAPQQVKTELPPSAVLLFEPVLPHSRSMQPKQNLLIKWAEFIAVLHSILKYGVAFPVSETVTSKVGQKHNTQEDDTQSRSPKEQFIPPQTNPYLILKSQKAVFHLF